MRYSIFTIILLFFSTQFTNAFELDFSGKHTTRYRNETARDRVQQRVNLKFAITIHGELELIAVAANGTAFNSGYDTIYDNSKDDEFDGADNIVKNLSFRKFYFQRKIQTNLTLQAGALPVEKGLTSITALDSNGWVDGFRVIKKGTALGDIKITAGSLTDREEINAFDREHELNYLEVSITKEIFDDLLFQIGYERHDDINYLTLAHKQKVALASDKIVTFVSEALVNLDESAIKASVGLKADLIHLLTNRKSGVTFELRTNYADENIGERGTGYTSGFRTSEGHYGTISAKFDINKKHNLSGYCRYRKNYDSDIDDERFECGVTKKH